MPIASTKCAWNFGSIAVSIFSTRRTSSSMVRREALSSSAMRAPVPAALPAEATCDRSQSGIMPSTMRVLDVDVAAERAGQADAIDVIGAQVLHQQLDAGVQGGLGELDGAHVVLRDLQRRLWPRTAYRRRCAPWARCAGCARRAPRRSRRPELMMPARYISAITSMIPEPQMPGDAGARRRPQRSPARRTTAPSRSP